MYKNILIAVISAALLALVLFPLFLAGSLESYVPEQDRRIELKDEAKFSKQYFSYVQAHDLKAVTASLDPKLVDAAFAENLKKVAYTFPKETPKSIKFIGANTNVHNGVSITGISSEYEFSNKWVLANALLLKQNNGFLVLGFSARPLDNSLEDSTHFSFWGQNAKHYVAFSAAILLLLFDIYVLALCIKTPTLKRKWLWIIVILVGSGRIEFNWLNGVFYFFGNYGGQESQSFFVDLFHFPVVNFSQMLYQPFIITMTIPLGAILFLLKHKK